MTKRLEELLEKEKQIKAQIQSVQAAERKKKKKQETRRRFLIGSAIMAQVESGDFSQESLTTLMDGFLTRPNERALFELEIPATTELDKKTPSVKAKSSASEVGPGGKKAKRTPRRTAKKKAPASSK